MTDWSIMDHDWPTYDPYQYYNYYQEAQPPQIAPPAQAYMPPSPTLTLLLSSPDLTTPQPLANEMQHANPPPPPKRDNPREIRNKAEKQRRDKLNQSISELASMVPPVVAASRKIEKTGVLRLTAHYLRAHQYVFGDSINKSNKEFKPSCVQALLAHLNGFLITTTYKGIVVVASKNVQRYLGYTELELLGHNILNIVHEDDRELMKEQIMPQPHMLGINGELLVPNEPNASQKIAEALASDKRRFMVRFKKLSQRSEPSQYITCHVEGSLRKADSACRGYNRCCQMVRRARSRCDNSGSSGNDVVFVGVVRPASDTFITESEMESFSMEYRTRHSIDGQIIQCEQRIALVTGYMTHEVYGVNAMNFMHRDDVRWVIIALREMYDQHRLFGESCYRLMTKTGQFIYMRTRGRLDVDQGSRAVTSFVCTNTVVDEKEGQYLIKMMKKKFTLLVNNNEEPPEEEEIKDTNDSQVVPVEDPRQLEKVILHLVTNLPSPDIDDIPPSISPERFDSPSFRLSIIPPRKERIVKAIEKIYSIISPLPKSRSSTYSYEDTNEASTSFCSTVTDVMPTPQLEPDDVLPPLTMIATSSNQDITETRLPNFSNIYYRHPTDMISNDNNYYNTAETEIDSLTHNITNPTGHYSGTASITFTNVGSNNQSDYSGNANGSGIRYQVYVAPPDDINQYQSGTNVSEIATQPGVKRSSDGRDQETVSRKKVAARKPEFTEQNYDPEPPMFDNFFDDDLLNTSFSQIDSAIDSLEPSIIDPSFPELLISTEVQEILREIDHPEESRRNN
ncbi:hypoxia-inducible factor 1-alpha-like [Achroia grisella]|uniref:hypoxia-inducible factor 1-alpha-like n=1 Tax=Achroia grisella TaxID=688607 RepID=UPI0027D2B6AE|nr:hypoxia-inducible factor 1-alpha-like [Achroia grisella]